jgi:hypothetical protein
MKPTPLKETRLLLNLYPVNSVRLNRIDHLLKMEGKSRTWWINAAVREKLDREHPETNCPESEYKPAPIPLGSPAADEYFAQQSRFVDHTIKLLQSFVPAAPLAGLPAIPDTKGMTPMEAMNACKNRLEALNEQEKDALFDAASVLAELPSGEPVRYPRKKAEQLGSVPLAAVVPVEAVTVQPMETVQDSDFWGEDEIAKGRELVKRHTR